MNAAIESYALWLADFYLLAAVLLAGALLASALVKQPARKLAIAKSSLVGLALLAALCALPGWSVVHLLAERPSQPPPPSNQPVPQVLSTESQVPTTPPTPVQELTPAPPPIHHPAPHPTAAWRRLSWATGFALAHVLGVACVLAWLTAGSLAARRLRRSATPAPAALAEVFAGIVGREDASGRRAELLVSERVDVAVALGVWRPVVMLPAAWVRSQSVEELRTALAHEAAHVRNHDLRWLATSRALFTLLWANPLYWLLRRRMRLDQETLADAAAAELSGRQRYAEQLVAWARDVAARPALRLSSAVGLWEGPSQLRRRVILLIDDRFTVLRDCSRVWRCSAAGVGGISAIALSLITLQPTHSQPPQVIIAQIVPTLEAGPRDDDDSNYVEIKCVDEKGQPLENVFVRLYRISIKTGEPPRMLVASFSGSHGNLTFRRVIKPDDDVWRRDYPKGKIKSRPGVLGFHKGEIAIVATSPGRTSVFYSHPETTVYHDGWKTEVRMPPGVVLQGRVTDPNGKPVSGATVSLMTIGIDDFQSARTDENGHYVVDDAQPFDMEEHRKQQAEWLRRMEEQTGSEHRADVLFISPPILTVEHPNFAVKKAGPEKIHGTKDIELEAASIIEGRVVYPDSGRPAADVLVQAQTTRPDDFLPRPDRIYQHYSASVRTNANGRFRFSNLPAGTYDVWPEADGWLHPGLGEVKVTADEQATLPDFSLTRGGTIRLRLVNTADFKPIEIDSDDQAHLALASEQRLSTRPLFQHLVKPQPEGTFELRALPGENLLLFQRITSDDRVKWITPHREGLATTKVDVVEGETATIDVPVDVPPQPDELEQATRLISEGQLEEAEKLFNVILEREPNYFSARLGRAEVWHRMGQYQKLVADYEQLIELDLPFPQNMIVYNNLAYLLAASPDDKVRDGKRAVELAEKAKQLQPEPSPDVLDTLAAAYAEAGNFDQAIKTQQEAIELAPEHRHAQLREYLKLYESHQPRRETRPTTGRQDNDSSAISRPVEVRLVQHTSRTSGGTASGDRPPALLTYGDGKPDGKKSYGGNGHLIRFEMPEGVAKVRGIRIHGSRYGLPQAPDEDVEITFLSEDRDETLHSEAAPYRLFKRGREQWVRVLFEKEVELPPKFWVALNFNAERTKGVYVSYDTSTKGEYSRVGRAGDEGEPQETDFGGDWMVQVMLSRGE